MKYVDIDGEMSVSGLGPLTYTATLLDDETTPDYLFEVIDGSSGDIYLKIG